MVRSATSAMPTATSGFMLLGSGPTWEDVQSALEAAGIQALLSDLSPRAIMQILECRPSTVILDARYDLDTAAQLCRSLRAVQAPGDLQIVTVTSSGDTKSPLLLYEAGVDNCWAFTAGPQLVQRVVTEFVEPPLPVRPPEILRCGTVTLDLERYTLTSAGRTVNVTALQLKLLSHLMARPGVVFSYRQLLHDVWGNPGGDERMVRAAMVRLRRLLGNDAARIRNIRGGGYAFRDKRIAR